MHSIVLTDTVTLSPNFVLNLTTPGVFQDTGLSIDIPQSPDGSVFQIAVNIRTFMVVPAGSLYDFIVMKLYHDGDEGREEIPGTTTMLNVTTPLAFPQAQTGSGYTYLFKVNALPPEGDNVRVYVALGVGNASTAQVTSDSNGFSTISRKLLS